MSNMPLPALNTDKKINKKYIKNLFSEMFKDYYKKDSLIHTIKMFKKSLNYKKEDEYLYNRLLFLEMRIYTQFLERIINGHLKSSDENILQKFLDGSITEGYDYILSCDWANIYNTDFNLLGIIDFYLTKYQKTFDPSSLSSRFILGSVVEFSIGLMMKVMGLDVKVTGETSRRHDLVVKLKNDKNVFYSIKSSTVDDQYPSNIILINVLSKENENIEWNEPTILYIKNHGLIYFDPTIMDKSYAFLSKSKIFINFKNVIEFLESNKEMFIKLDNSLAQNVIESKNRLSPNLTIFRILLEDGIPLNSDKVLSHIT